MNTITKKLQFLRHKPSRLAIVGICLMAVIFSGTAFLRFDSIVQYGTGSLTTDVTIQNTLSWTRSITWNDLKGSSGPETQGIAPCDFLFQNVYDDDHDSNLSVNSSIVQLLQSSSYTVSNQDVILSVVPKFIPQRSPPISA